MVGLTVALCAMALGCGKVDEVGGAPASGTPHDADTAGGGSDVSSGGAAPTDIGNASGGMAPSANGGATSSDPPGDALIGYDSLQLVVTGGYGPGECANGHNTYTITRVPAQISWVGCDYDKTPAEPMMGERPLSAPEFDAVIRALQKVRAGKPDQCGSDASAILLDVHVGTRVDRYADDFYSGCPWGPLVGRIFVTGLSDLVNFAWYAPSSGK